MQIEIQVRGSAVDDTLRALIRRRLRFALGSASHRVHNVAVVLDDQNGPRGGFDKQCTMRAILPGLTPVIIEQTEADVQVAIDRAADRLGPPYRVPIMASPIRSRRDNQLSLELMRSLA